MDRISTSLGNLTEKMAQEMVKEATDSLESPPDDGVVLQVEERGSIFEKLRFAWRPEDQAVLDKVRLAADQKFAELFAEAVEAIDTFYQALRVPEVTASGVLHVGPDHRPIWRRNAAGKIIEQWDQLTGQDIEQALMNIERVRLQVAPEVSWLMNEAIYARHVADDAKDDAWASVLQGTQGDRTAKANRVSRQDRYHAYFRYVLWSQSNVFLTELNIFAKRLSDVRYWRVQSMNG